MIVSAAVEVEVESINEVGSLVVDDHAAGYSAIGLPASAGLDGL